MVRHMISKDEKKQHKNRECFALFQRPSERASGAEAHVQSILAIHYAADVRC